MKYKIINILTLVGLALCLGNLNSLYSQINTVTSPSDSDTTIYAKTPEDYKPYHRFQKPYRKFFITKLEYPGYGRHIPEPTNIKTVKIGFLGPIIGSLTESIGGQRDLPQKVGQTMTNWDGYLVSNLAPLGIMMLKGARLAVEQANSRGGYRGKIPYELVIRNDNGFWQTSGKKIIQMAYHDSVWAILGSVDGEDSHIAIRIAFKIEIPVMNTADTDPTLVETSIPWLFRCITDDRQMCYLLADFAFKKLGLTRVAALRASNRYGRISIDEFRDAATRLGKPFLVEMQYQEGDTDFSSQLERIKALDADGVVTFGNSLESALILKQMREMGMNQWFLGSDRIVTDEFIEIVGQNHGRVAAGYPYDPTRKDSLYLRFINDFQKQYNETPETYAAHAYDGMNMIIAAIEKAGLNRALIRDELATMSNYYGVTGRKDFDDSASNRTPAILTIMKKGGFEFFTREEIFSEKFQLEQ